MFVCYSILFSSHNMINDQISIAMETKEHLLSQRQNFKRLQTRFIDISNRFPVISRWINGIFVVVGVIKLIFVCFPPVWCSESTFVNEGTRWFWAVSLRSVRFCYFFILFIDELFGGRSRFPPELSSSVHCLIGFWENLKQSGHTKWEIK